MNVELLYFGMVTAKKFALQTHPSLAEFGSALGGHVRQLPFKSMNVLPSHGSKSTGIGSDHCVPAELLAKQKNICRLVIASAARMSLAQKRC